jgi:hypothetical protein
VDRVIFCGSIVPENFPFDEDRFTGVIVNDIGIKDYLPILAESVTWGYGSVGHWGFMGGLCKTDGITVLAIAPFLTGGFARTSGYRI